MTKNHALKLKQTPKAFFRDSKNSITIEIGKALGFIAPSNTPPPLNFVQKLGIKGFGFLTRKIMTKNHALKLKQTPRAFFRDSKNNFVIIIGKVLRISDNIDVSQNKENFNPSSDATMPHNGNETYQKIDTVNTKEKKPISNIRDVNVAVILDEFSYNSFKYEFNPIVIEPDNWRQKFKDTPPDLFFCESAWLGADSERKPWRGKICSGINTTVENKTELLDIIRYCNDNNIPTIFWNKEDPTHFDDPVHAFVETATLFDFVFTSDEDCIPRYKNEYHCKNVFCLPFATQPKLFNPIEKQPRSEKVVFAGSWYKHHKERSKDMELIFDNILANDREIEIYDRCYFRGDENHYYPKKYRNFTIPPVSHDEISNVYKSSIFGLNINTVKQSGSMFARRVYELMSCNTFIISNYSLGVSNLLKDNIVFADEQPEKLKTLSKAEIKRIRDENLHLALEKHTYTERFRFILDTIGFPYKPLNESITIVCLANSESDIPKILSFYRKQHLNNKSILIVLSNKIPDIQIAPLYTQYNKVDVSIVAASYLEKYNDQWDSIIETNHFAIMNFDKSIDKKTIHKARLHMSYIDDPIIIGSNKKYSYSKTALVKNVIADKKYFTDLLKNYDKRLKGSFYHV